MGGALGETEESEKNESSRGESVGHLPRAASGCEAPEGFTRTARSGAWESLDSTVAEAGRRGPSNGSLMNGGHWQLAEDERFWLSETAPGLAQHCSAWAGWLEQQQSQQNPGGATR